MHNIVVSGEDNTHRRGGLVGLHQSSDIEGSRDSYGPGWDSSDYSMARLI
jgi:hypothetical protein